MAFKSQGGGGGGGGQGPWGGGSSGPTPPNIEELLRKGQDRFKKFLPSGSGNIRILVLIVIAVIGIWGFSGFYRVQPGEQGVELLFGRFVKQTAPGLNYWFPAPIGEVLKPNVERTNTITIGFREAGEGRRGGGAREVPQESLMLTGDQNIIDIDFVVQWRIKNAEDYLFNIRDPDATVKLASESAIREVIGQTTLEDALALKRTEVEIKTKALLQKILDSYGAGVFIAEVKMQKVEPPQAVIDAFHDVQRAKQDRERQQNEAEAYRNDIVPKAKGEAQRIIQGAVGYREQQIKEAEGEAKRFLSVYEAYKTGKEVTSKRLYRERMQQGLAKSDKVIIDTGRGGPGVVPYLALPEIRKRSTGGEQ
ncbi:MAG: FtsH protease activity modulator HflK [Proteobacteria bacterium]|nr:FtsH protease activity modulator HflK [Pseudomonadota bacterium]